MKRILLALLIATQSFGSELSSSKTGDGAGYASRDATSLSMMGWGLSLAVGIAALVVLIPNETSSSH